MLNDPLWGWEAPRTFSRTRDFEPLRLPLRAFPLRECRWEYFHWENPTEKCSLKEPYWELFWKGFFFVNNFSALVVIDGGHTLESSVVLRTVLRVLWMLFEMSVDHSKACPPLDTHPTEHSRETWQSNSPNLLTLNRLLAPANAPSVRQPPFISPYFVTKNLIKSEI